MYETNQCSFKCLPFLFSSFFFFFFHFFHFSFSPVLYCPLWEIRVSFPVLGTVDAGAALPTPNGVCTISVCPNNGLAAVFGILTCAQMLQHTIAHGGCTDTVRESAPPKVDTGRKIPRRTWHPYLSRYCAWLFTESDAVQAELFSSPDTSYITE